MNYVKHNQPVQGQSINEATLVVVMKWRMVMFVSGVVATAALVGIMVALFIAGIVLAYVDSHVNKQRRH